MIRPTFSLCLLLFICACGDSTSDTAAATDTENETTPTTETSSPVRTYSIPCESVSNDRIAEVFNWTGVSSSADELQDGRIQACTYHADGDDGAVLRLDYSNDYAINNQYLENSYQKYLSEGMAGYAYQTVNEGPGDETLMGYAYQYRKHNYLLRSRIANDLELILDASFLEEQDAAAVQEKLLALAADMLK